MDKMKIFSVFLSFAVLLGLTGNVLYESQIDVAQSSLGGAVITLLVGIVVAVNLLPIIFNQTNTLETDAGGYLDTNEESIIGVWNILIIVGVMLAIIGIAM